MTSQSPSEGMPQTVPNSTLALVSLITGILGLTFFPFLGSVIAVITGPMAKREIRESAGTLGGESLATIGQVLGWIGIGLAVLGICVVIIVFALFGIVSETSISTLLMGFLV